MGPTISKEGERMGMAIVGRSDPGTRRHQPAMAPTSLVPAARSPNAFTTATIPGVFAFARSSPTAWDEEIK